ncbi:uncharacterized protein SCHCODRAFT_02147438 [Schizophyllum commune H4-8]|uniref:uncharacterized protein n=1 Tax=Schizophyllum commune (strain H4-8 / FGSC 9210) TaxID=578458 RepID=UPI00215F1454|nr:uncharacterized protein SCHCODRAFT_02147438 [Schizophyllum commune H4-8]KAI5897714.1 hypothetical protein SCHCODRAFT_02147438 [Schizophyllum commune H4-8]
MDVVSPCNSAADRQRVITREMDKGTHGGQESRTRWSPPRVLLSALCNGCLSPSPLSNAGHAPEQVRANNSGDRGIKDGWRWQRAPSLVGGRECGSLGEESKGCVGRALRRLCGATPGISTLYTHPAGMLPHRNSVHFPRVSRSPLLSSFRRKGSLFGFRYLAIYIMNLTPSPSTPRLHSRTSSG